jgi:ubiquinone/menaquinone biosynthesis C-methylase UbiE
MRESDGGSGGWWRRVVRRLHPEGIPWPATVLYDAISRSAIFQQHYRLIAEDVARYCRGGRILDVGMGTGRLLLVLRRSVPDAQLAGVDISPGMVSKARANVERAGSSGTIELREAAAAALPFPDGAFDLAVSTGSIHHWKDPVAGLDEMYRVLRPGGYALLYDVVARMPREVAEGARRKFGRLRIGLLWLHSFEEPFYDAEEFDALARRTHFGSGETHFVGVLCCLVLQKQSLPAAPES